MADGSGGTHAGLLAGLGAAQPDARRRRRRRHAPGSRRGRPCARSRRRARSSTRAEPSAYGDRRPRPLRRRATAADPTRASTRSVSWRATEGLVLDPVYSGKAMAALFDWLRDGRIGAGRDGALLGTPADHPRCSSTLRGRAHDRAVTRTSGPAAAGPLAVDVVVSDTIRPRRAPCTRRLHRGEHEQEQEELLHGAPFRSARCAASRCYRREGVEDGETLTPNTCSCRVSGPAGVPRRCRLEAPASVREAHRRECRGARAVDRVGHGAVGAGRRSARRALTRDDVSDDALAHDLVALRRQIDRQEAVFAAMAARGHRRGIGGRDGAASTAAWLSHRARMRAGDAKRRDRSR